MANRLVDEETAKRWSQIALKQAIEDTVLWRFFPPPPPQPPLTRAQKLKRYIEEWQYRLTHAWSALKGERCDTY
jgi:hypothetical protein